MYIYIYIHRIYKYTCISPLCLVSYPEFVWRWIPHSSCTKPATHRSCGGVAYLWGFVSWGPGGSCDKGSVVKLRGEMPKEDTDAAWNTTSHFKTNTWIHLHCLDSLYRTTEIHEVETRLATDPVLAHCCPANFHRVKIQWALGLGLLLGACLWCLRPFGTTDSARVPIWKPAVMCAW